MTLMVDYCPRCGSIYQKNMRNMCNGCRDELDQKLNHCLDHLWRNPKSTTEQLSAATGMDMQELYRYIQEGRFTYNHPNLTFPCECCSQPINRGRLCNQCLGTFREAFPAPQPKQQPARATGGRATSKVLYTSRNSSRR